MVQKRKSFSQQKITILLVISGLKMSAQDTSAHVDLCFMTVCMRVSALVYMTEHLPKAVPLSQRLSSKIQWSSSYLKHSVKITESHDMTTFTTTVFEKSCNEKSSDLHFYHNCTEMYVSHLLALSYLHLQLDSDKPTYRSKLTVSIRFVT